MEDAEIIKSEIAEVFVQLNKVEDQVKQAVSNQLAIKKVLILIADNQKQITNQLNKLTQPPN